MVYLRFFLASWGRSLLIKISLFDLLFLDLLDLRTLFFHFNLPGCLWDTVMTSVGMLLSSTDPQMGWLRAESPLSSPLPPGWWYMGLAPQWLATRPHDSCWCARLDSTVWAALESLAELETHTWWGRVRSTLEGWWCQSTGEHKSRVHDVN